MFLVEEVQAGLPVEGAEFALKRVMLRQGRFSSFCTLQELSAGNHKLVLAKAGGLLAVPSFQVLAASREASEMADREIRVMQQLQHSNIMTLLAHSRAMAPMDADQDVTTYYMLFPLYKARRSLQMWELGLGRSLWCPA